MPLSVDTLPTEPQIATAFGSMIQVISCLVVSVVWKGGAAAALVAAGGGDASLQPINTIAHSGTQASRLFMRVSLAEGYVAATSICCEQRRI